MNALELKVPPPLVALAIALAMWVVARSTFVFQFEVALRIALAIGIASIGAAFSIMGIIAFHRVRATLNPTKPQAASSLVTSGIYRVTRNPMYVGLLFVLTAWAVFLCAPWTLAGPLLFVVYMNRFQIEPEEKALMNAFGEGYAQYKRTVRRWF